MAVGYLRTSFLWLPPEKAYNFPTLGQFTKALQRLSNGNDTKETLMNLKGCSYLDVVMSMAGLRASSLRPGPLILRFPESSTMTGGWQALNEMDLNPSCHICGVSDV